MPSQDQEPEISKEDEVREKMESHSIQLFYYTFTKMLKNYHLVKSNPSIFKNNWACDKCYYVYKSEDTKYEHEAEDITLCKGCLYKTTAVDKYNKIEAKVNPLTGLTF